MQQLAARNVLRNGLTALVNDNLNFNNEVWVGNINNFASFAQNSIESYDYTAVHLTLANGDVIFTTNPAYEDLNISHRGYFQNAMSNQLAWSEYEYSDIINTNYIAVAQPVYAVGSNEIIGIVSVVVDDMTIQNMLHENAYLIGETADVYLVDEEGLLLTNTLRGEHTNNAALNQSIDSEATRMAASLIQSGNIGAYDYGEYNDYGGEPVIGEVRAVGLGEEIVGLVIEIDQTEAYAAVSRIQAFMLIVLAVATPLIATIGYTIANSIARPIIKIQEVLGKVGQNDLRVKADIKSNDEVGMMATDLNVTIENLNKSLNQVKMATNNVQYGTEEIATGNQDLSQRTEEQASSLEEIASTIEEITSSMDMSSANATEADNLSQRTLETVQQGEEVVGNLKESMIEITNGSKEISEIISTVNDIAFQTNLLALNAAVEAARAGEQGRGFAVVAAEVRNLAGRSADAAKEIETLIKASIDRVDRGNQEMDDTQKVLNAIVENTRKTTDVVGEIAASLREQTTSAADIRIAIDELNQATQQNASLVEEIASASENMSSEAIDLNELVSRFKLNPDTESSTLSANQKGSTKPSAPRGFNDISNRKKSNQVDNDIDDMDNFSDVDFEKF
ncbi:methyl-accepting chemotaxis protein [Desulfitispora alkaliphila]|uniref:methyl-accepting chemotaxis protein n=1 Tax=Desulfitispora alkaliphila TaxID=622674 RepID=UPI003D1E9AA7